MTQKQKRWAVVFGCFIGAALGPAVTIFFTIGLLIAPLISEFGWSQSEISLIIPGLTLAVALATPVAGYLIDRWGAKTVILPSVMLYGMCLFLFNFVNELWSFYALFMVIGLFCAGSNTMSFITILTRWFDKNRGLMIGIAASGTGAGTLLLSPFVQWLIETSGWRSAYSGVGAVILFFGLPIMYFTLKNAPDVDVATVNRVTAPADYKDEKVIPADFSPVDFSYVMKIRAFWIILMAFVCIQAAIYSCGVYLAPIIQDNGGSTGFSVLCVSLFGGAVMVGRIVTGLLFDYLFAPRVCATIFFGALVGILMLAFGASSWLAIISALLIGFSTGTEGDGMGYLLSRYIPREVFGRAYATVFACCMVSLAGFPFLTGVARDVFGDYQGILILLAVLSAISVICMLSLPPFRQSNTDTGHPK